MKSWNIILTMIIILSSCSSSPKPEPAKKEPVPQKETEDLSNPLETPDLTFFELKGPIKCLLIYSYHWDREDYDSIFFDREGTLKAIYLNGYRSWMKSPYFSKESNWGYIRDEKTGQFCRFQGYDGEEEYEWLNGRVHVRRNCGEGHTRIDSLRYNERGQLKEYISVFLGPDKQPEWSDTVEYKYEVIDKYGNWTKRTEIHKRSAVYHDGVLASRAREHTFYQRRRFFYY